jgi:hypothetical protein
MTKIALLLCLTLVPVGLFSQSAAVPTPESVFGFPAGADFKLVNYEQAIAYFKKVQAVAGGRMQMVTAGKTSQGRTYEFALISSKDNLAKVDRYREIARRLAHPEGVTDAEARALAKEGKAFVHIDGGLHANEVAGAQMTPQLLYDLISSTDPATASIFDNVILMLWPTINPDGMTMVSDWGMAHNGSVNLPQLYQDYVGHDNNRDAYMLNMIESRVMEHTWRDWEPNIIHVFHQAPSQPYRIWLPPFAEPIPAHAPPIPSAEVNMIGMAIGQKLDQEGKPGATHMGNGFDAWYAGYIDYNPILKNIPSFWTETQGSGATVQTNPAPSVTPKSMTPSAWAGGEWHLRDAVAYDETASMADLEYAWKYKESLLYGKYESARDQIANGRKVGAAAYVVPQGQRDPVAAVELLRRLAFAGVHVSQLTAAVEIDNVSYPAGTWIVPRDQEFTALADEVLLPQKYPDLREYPGGPLDQPYDAAGWTLPFQMGVNVVTATTPLSDDVRAKMKMLGPAYDFKQKPTPYNTEKGTDAAPFDSVPGIGFDASPAAAAILPLAGKISGTGPVLALDPAQNNTFRALYRAWKSGGAVRYVAASGSNGARYVITGLPAGAQDDLVKTLALQAEHAAATAGVEVKKPRVALYNSPSSMDDGWTRWVLEQYGIEYTPVAPADFPGAGALKDRFDVVVVSSEGGGAFGGGGGRGGGRGGGGAGRPGGAGAAGAAPAPSPEDRVKAITDFVNAGGTIVCFNQSATSAVSALHLPVMNAPMPMAQGAGQAAGQGGRPDRAQFFVGGSILQINIDNTQRVMAGMPAQAGVFFDSGPVFETGADFKGAVLAKYQDSGSPLMSGFLLGEKYLNGKAAALDVDLGSGHVVLLGFRPQWRGQPFGDFKMIFNAVLSGR